MKKIYLWLAAAVSLWGDAAQTNMAPFGVDTRQYMKISILDQRVLSYDDIDGVHFSEISDAAYSKSKNRLYLVSDEGALFSFSAQFDDKITRLEPSGAVKLMDKNGKKFKNWLHDSEGMTIAQDGKLLISFEGKAKIAHFDTDGQMRKKYEIPAKLSNPKNYRTSNKSLESVAWHPKYGILTAAEWPLKRDGIKEQTVYALSGQEWRFRAEEAANSAVVSMEVMDDGTVLVLERAYSGFTAPVVITLKKVWLGKSKKGVCKTEVLARFSNAEGWHLDNFEGLAKVGKNRYVIVSDDNDNFYQRTLLVYFEAR